MSTSFIVPPERDGSRLDSFLSRVTEASKRAAKDHCDAGHVLIDGKRGRAGTLLRSGATVTLAEPILPVSVRPELVEEAGGVQKLIGILFENEDLLGVEKLMPMPSVRHRHEDPVTVADCVAAHAPSAADASLDPREGGLVQRLDFYTTGVLVAAKNRDAWRRMRALLASGEMEKSYLALVVGEVKKTPFTLDRRIRYGAKGVTVLPDDSANDGVTALTKVALLAVRTIGEKTVSVVRCEARSARRHQVRAHLADAGHPLVGDGEYGASLSLRGLGIDRDGFLLHAERMRFSDSDAEIEIAAPSQLISGIV